MVSISLYLCALLLVTLTFKNNEIFKQKKLENPYRIREKTHNQISMKVHLKYLQQFFTIWMHTSETKSPTLCHNFFNNQSCHEWAPFPWERERIGGGLYPHPTDTHLHLIMQELNLRVHQLDSSCDCRFPWFFPLLMALPFKSAHYFLCW